VKPRKRNDTGNPVTFTLKDKDGVVDLTTADNVNFVMAGAAGVKVDKPCVIAIDPATGRVTYTFEAEDVDEAGAYRVELRVDWAGGGRTTFPSSGYETLTIEEDLTDEGP